MANQIDNDAKIIAGDDYGFGHPAICRLSSTVMLAAHINESNELEIHKSADDGLNWVLKKSLPNASGSFNFAAMTATKAGIVYQLNNNEFEVWVTTDAGENWTNKLDLTTGIGSSDKAVLLYDSSLSRLHVIWENSTDIKFYGKYSDDDGASWNDWSASRPQDNVSDADIDPATNNIRVIGEYSTVRLYVNTMSSIGVMVSQVNYTISGNTYHDKSMAIDSSGNWYMLYIRRYTSTAKEYLTIRRNAVAEITLYDPTADNIIIKGSISMGIDEDDNVFVYYTKTSDEKTYFRKYDAGTATWGAETELIGVANNRINTEKHILALSNKLHFVYYQAP